MSFTEILFYVFSAVLVVSSIGVITARNPVHAALFLVFAFFNSAVLWLLMEAEFLAIVLVLVYVGAVMVLFLFVVMMLDINIAQMRAGFAKYAPLGIVVALIVVGEIGSVVWLKSSGSEAVANALGASSGAAAPAAAPGYSNTQALGELLYTQYLYPLELASVLLLVAIVAAISLTMHKRTGQKVQDVSAQVNVNAKDRVRIVKMAPEKEPTAEPKV